MIKRMVITGYGTIAKELLKLIVENKIMIEKKYNLVIDVVGIIGSEYTVYQKNGVNLKKLLNYGIGSRALYKYKKDTMIENSSLDNIKGDILIEATPTNIKTGEPGYSYIKWAIKKKMDIVSVSKGSLVKYFDEIIKLSKENNIKLKYSGATMAALPSMDIGEYSLASTKIEKIEGILNGTSNYILSEMYDNETDFEKTVIKAQKQGITEKNIDYDVMGIDSGNKIYILYRSLINKKYKYNDINIEGINNIKIENIKKLKKENKKIKLIATACDKEISVKPSIIDPSNPLYYVDGKEKGIVFHTKDMGRIVTTGGESSPKGAASSVLKDIINISRTKVQYW